MRALLDMPVRDLLRSAGGYLLVGTVAWLPALVWVLGAKP